MHFVAVKEHICYVGRCLEVSCDYNPNTTVSAPNTSLSGLRMIVSTDVEPLNCSDEALSDVVCPE